MPDFWIRVYHEGQKQIESHYTRNCIGTVAGIAVNTERYFLYFNSWMLPILDGFFTLQ